MGVPLRVFLGSSPISWKTKKQTTLPHSYVEVEYRSMATTACELIWLRTLLNDLMIPHPLLAQLHCDNRATIHITANPVYHEHTKHIEIDCHFIRDCIKSTRSLRHMFFLISSWLASLPKHWVVISFISLLASWAFVFGQNQIDI